MSDLTSVELADVISECIRDERAGGDDDGNCVYWLSPSVHPARQHVIAVDLVRMDDGTVARTYRLTVERL